MLQTIIKNTASNVGLFIARLVITFIMTPILVRNLGNHDYGIWEVVVAIIGYMGMLDLGVRPAASRFAAFYNAKKDSDLLQKVYSTTVFLMFIVSTIAAAILLIWAIWFPDTIARSDSEIEKYTFFLVIIAIQLFFSFPGQISESFLEGLQQYHLKNMITLIVAVIGTIIMYNYITPANALILLAFIHTFGRIIKFVIFHFLLSRPKYGQIRFSVNDISLDQTREIITFGFKTFVQGAATRISSGANTIIIASLIGPAVVIYYAISANLTTYITTARMLLTHAFMPLFSHYHALEKTGEIKKWFLFGTRIVNACIYALALEIVLLGRDFISIWIGQEYADKGSMILYMLCLYQVVISFSPFSSRYLTAINKHGYIAKVMAVSALVHVVLSILFSFIAGVEGVALGLLLPSFVTVALILNYTCNSLGITVWSFLKEVVLSLFIPVCSLIAGTLLVKAYIDMNSYLNLLIAGSAGSVFFAVSFYYFSVTKQERTYLMSRMGLRKTV